MNSLDLENLNEIQIPIVLYNKLLILIIIDSKVVGFHPHGSMENKSWGTDFLASKILSEVVNLIALPEHLVSLIEPISSFYKLLISDSIHSEKLRNIFQIHTDESGLFKDIIGSYGPLYWGFFLGTSLKMDLDPTSTNFKISNIEVEEHPLNNFVELTPLEAFHFVANHLLTFLRTESEEISELIKQLKWALQYSEDYFDLVKPQIEKMVQRHVKFGRKFLGDDDDRSDFYANLFRFSYAYLCHLHLLLETDEITATEILRLSGVGTLELLFQNPKITQFYQSVFENRHEWLIIDRLGTNWKALLYTVLHNLNESRIPVNDIGTKLEKLDIHEFDPFLKIKIADSFVAIPGPASEIFNLGVKNF